MTLKEGNDASILVGGFWNNCWSRAHSLSNQRLQELEESVVSTLKIPAGTLVSSWRPDRGYGAGLLDLGAINFQRLLVGRDPGHPGVFCGFHGLNLLDAGEHPLSASPAVTTRNARRAHERLWRIPEGNSWAPFAVICPCTCIQSSPCQTPPSPQMTPSWLPQPVAPGDDCQGLNGG